MLWKHVIQPACLQNTLSFLENSTFLWRRVYTKASFPKPKQNKCFIADWMQVRKLKLLLEIICVLKSEKVQWRSQSLTVLKRHFSAQKGQETRDRTNNSEFHKKCMFIRWIKPDQWQPLHQQFSLTCQIHLFLLNNLKKSQQSQDLFMSLLSELTLSTIWPPCKIYHLKKGTQKKPVNQKLVHNCENTQSKCIANFWMCRYHYHHPSHTFSTYGVSVLAGAPPRH